MCVTIQNFGTTTRRDISFAEARVFRFSFDPRDVPVHPGVHAWVIWLGAPFAPRHHPCNSLCHGLPFLLLTHKITRSVLSLVTYLLIYSSIQTVTHLFIYPSIHSFTLWPTVQSKYSAKSSVLCPRFC